MVESIYFLKPAVDLAFVSFFSTPLNHRDQAAIVSAVLAPIASRPVRLRGYEMTPYTGYLRSESLGQRADKLFSPPAATHKRHYRGRAPSF